MTTGADVRIEVLGQIQVMDDDAVVSLSPQTRRLIGVLVSVAGEAVSADRIAEYVADGRAEGSSVRTAVSRARKVLGERLSFGEGGYRLSLTDDEFDAASFEELVGGARSVSNEVRVEALASALGLWRGRAFGELAEEEWAVSMATRLDLARVTVTEDLAATLLAVGRPSGAVEILEAHIVEHAYRERPVGLLMRALDATGRRSDAVRAYQRFRATLRDDTGLDPSSELRDLEADLLADDVGSVASVSRLPTGTVTFLFTDIEGSTERWAADEGAMAAALAAHDSAIRGAVESHGGVVFKHTGDGMCAAFVSAPEAVAAACEAAPVEVQAGLELRVRIGLHTGEAESRDGDYFGPTLNRVARVMDAGHGGQVLVSSATAGLVRDHELIDLGEHQLKGLDAAERIFQVGLGEFPALRTPRPVLGNMPVELSTFVGRVDEVTSLVEELVEHRLVTLIGVGGAGKTRLSVEAARSVSESFPDGCWMVELAVVAVAEAVPFAFCAGLSIKAPPEGDVTGHLVARLGDRRALVVVDNCEHLLAAAADVVEHIVASCPNVVVLVTSREPLMIRGERLVPVPSLLPHDAERLFLERARDEAPDLVIDADQARAVTELCERLDGLPLALELAASRVRAFSPVELVINLEERFRMLVGGRRSLMERHQTMRGTLDWSYELCSEVEQDVFDRLSAFPAGFDMPAARAVAGGEAVSEFDVVDVVPQLVDRSLLQRSTAPDGTTRYRMLETMRAYAREHLQHEGTADTTRARHAHYMAATIGPLTLHTVGPDEEQVNQRLDEYLADSLVALDWFIDHQEWEHGLRVIPPGFSVSERDSGAMIGRLHEAARVGGAPAALLDELANYDNRWLLVATFEQQIERGWRLIRAQGPIPSDRFVQSPYRDFADGGVAEADVDEYLASVDRWLAAPPATRAVAEWGFVRSLASSGHLDLADEPLSRFAAFVAELHSVGMARMVDDLHGTVARLRQDWVGAASWYGKVVDAGNGQLHQWIDLSAAWHLLTARCLCEGELHIAGHQLRDPWLFYREQRLDLLRWRGSVATALALHRLGHTDLANRFAAWVLRSDHEPIMTPQFVGVLEIAGLPPTDFDGNDDLDALIDELLIVADEIDQRTK